MGRLKDLLSLEGIDLDGMVVKNMDMFVDILSEWNQVHNLTGAKTQKDKYENIIDSLYPLTFIDRPETLLDVGTGAGFPGLVLGMAMPECRTVLCEPINKRASFLKYAIMELGLENISVKKTRVEELQMEPFDMISSRAVSDTAMLLDLTRHLRGDNTQYLLYKGSRLPEELEALNSQPNYAIVQKNKRNYLWIK